MNNSNQYCLLNFNQRSMQNLAGFVQKKLW